MYNYFMIIGNVAEIESSFVTVKVQRPFKNAQGEFEFDYLVVETPEYVGQMTNEGFKVGDHISIKGRMIPSGTQARLIGERIMK